MEDKCSRFLKATADRGPRDLLVSALENSPTDGRAIDLGCGAGNDTLAMLQHGLRVLATDLSDEAVQMTTERARSNGYEERFEGRVIPFEQLELPPSQHALVYAGLSLPFCKPESFADLWRGIEATLRPGGIFACHLFGDRDEWASTPDSAAKTFHSAAEVEELTNGWEHLYFEEKEFDGTTALGGEKHWHVFELILRNSPK